MTKYNEAGKGSKQRPTNRKKYEDNYDTIFRKPKKEEHDGVEHTAEYYDTERNR
jgi:hypothetical protein